MEKKLVSKAAFVALYLWVFASLLAYLAQFRDVILLILRSLA